jgi:RRXRR protein
MFVPVVDSNQKPLMPTTPARARHWLKCGKATAFWSGGIFCVRLNAEPSARHTQPVAVGIDPGSKREGYSVISPIHTYLNIQAEVRTNVQEAEQQSTRMRRARRYRKTPYRQPRSNRHQARKKLPPSTRARWQWKLRLAIWLCRLFPVTNFIVEDIKASTRPGRGGRWNRTFSPLQAGKAWFYSALHRLAPVTIRQGWETQAHREQLGLKKTNRKLAEFWHAHCVDAWVLAHSLVGGGMTPDNTRLVCIVPLLWHRRQLHRLQPEKGGKRKPYGGILSQGIKRGTLIQHPKWGKAYVGGTLEGRLSLHDPIIGKRITQTAKVIDCRIIKLLRWRTRLVTVSTPLPRKERSLPPSA